MKKIFNVSVITLFILLISCGTKSSDNVTNNEYSEIDYVQNDCDNQVSFGNTPICLMKIDGMKECYSNPLVKVYMDQFKFAKNDILGIYLNDNVYSEVEKLGEFPFDDYFKVYSLSVIKNMSLDNEKLEMIALETESMFSKKWTDIESILKKSKSYDLGISFDRPIILESHWPNKDIKSYVCLVKMESNGVSVFLVMTLNLVLIKDKVIFYAYYKNYDGQESIENAKAKSDYFGLKFYEANS